jgi:hypothetical protein
VWNVADINESDGDPIHEPTDDATTATIAAVKRTATRKSPWNKRRDRQIAAIIAVVCVAMGVTVWVTSDSRATTSTLAAPDAPIPPNPAAVPTSLRELWQAASPATPIPVAVGPNVITGADGQVQARDPFTGAVRWRYARDLPLCTVASGWSRVVAVYGKTGLANTGGCSETTQFDPATGRRTAQRDGDAEFGTRLITDGATMTATGKKLLTSWRDDLVKTMEYGQVPALVNPNKQPRKDCTYGSVAVSSGQIGVIERCKDDPADRLTVYRSTAESGKDSDEPSVLFSTVLPGKSAKLVALTGYSAAVALPEQNLLALYDSNGTQQSTYPLTVDPSSLAQDPAGGLMTTTVTENTVYWFSGGKTVSLGKTNLTPTWTLNGTMGPGTIFANQLLVPVPSGLAVVDPESGKTTRTIGVDRHGYSGTVILRSLGAVLLEQRGDTLVALG